MWSGVLPWVVVCVCGVGVCIPAGYQSKKGLELSGWGLCPGFATSGIVGRGIRVRRDPRRVVQRWGRLQCVRVWIV